MISLKSTNNGNDLIADVAVGAPGSGEGGMVFIYMGQREGLNPQYTQVIRSPFHSHVPAFGFSIRGGTDIDNNGYPGFYSASLILHLSYLKFI